MKKLKNKIFYTIFSLITLFSLCVFFLYNTKNYIDKKRQIINSLNLVSPKKNFTKNNLDINRPNKEPIPIDKPFDNNIKFIDSVIYTILIDDNNNIKEIINRSNNNLTDDEIRVLASNILNKTNISKRYVGCLYFTNYSYSYFKGDSLIILDNTSIKNALLQSLGLSLLLFSLIEIIAILVSKLITNWIIKPVIYSFERQKEFVANASHELKTPLSIIMASCDLLEEDSKETKWSKNIKNEVSRMNNLVSDLLELASTEKEELFQKKISNLSKTVELTLLTFEAKAYEQKIKLKYDITEEIIYPYDENSIEQLVEILLDNALKHAKKKIDVYLSKDKSGIVFTVTNDGDVIPNGEEEKIFERFYRIDKARSLKENRYGLGLAIAKNIVQNHNGKISAFSNDGKTIFKVVFKK